MKKIIAVMLIMAMLICGCGTAEDSTDEPTNVTLGSGMDTDSAPEATSASTEPSEDVTGPSSEATESSTEVTESSTEATEPTEAPTEPVTDPYADIKYYPFPLLDMTVAEIEAAYGELEYVYYESGGTPVYSITELGFELEFNSLENLGIDLFDPLPKDAKPKCLRLCADQMIYPGLKVGMVHEEIPSDLEWFNPGLYNLSIDVSLYCATLYQDDCAINVMFNIPDNIIKEYPPFFTNEQLEALKPWADEFIYNLYDTEICGIEIYKHI